MAKPAVRLQVVEVAVFLGLLLLLGRAAQVQLLQGRRWAEEARARRTERIVLPARRGALLDRHGAPGSRRCANGMRTSEGPTALLRWSRCAGCAACTWSRCQAAFIPSPRWRA